MRHMRRVGFVVMWVAASFATALVAWSAVRLAGDQVSERPVRPLSADEVAALAPTTLPHAPAASSSSTTTSRSAVASSALTAATTATTTTTRPVRTTTTTRQLQTTTTTSRPPAAPTTSTSTSSAPQPTTTTSAAPTVTAYQLAGGTVVISVSPGQVSLVSASPRAGFAMEIDAAGPDEVRVEFEGETDSEFRARWSGGALDVDIDEE